MTKQNSLDRFIQSASFKPERRYIPSSLFSVNLAIDNAHGFQSGRFVELCGMFSSGKSTLALDLVKNAQTMGLQCAYIDVERAFDPDYAQQLGVNTDTLQIVRADTAEHNLEVSEYLARQGYGLIVIDSIPALVPSAHVEEAPEDTTADIDYSKPKKIAALGTLVGDWSKRMIPIIDYHNTLIVCINQFRANMSTMSRIEKKPYGPYVYNHNLTWRIELVRVKKEDDRVAVQARVTKNRLGKEQGLAEYDIIYGQGLDIAGDVLTLAVQRGIVHKHKAGWYEWQGKKAQGSEKASQLFDIDAIKQEVINAVV